MHQTVARISGTGMLRLGAGEVGQALPPAFAWWRDFATRDVAAPSVQDAGAEDCAALPELPPPHEAVIMHDVGPADVPVGHFARQQRQRTRQTALHQGRRREP